MRFLVENGELVADSIEWAGITISKSKYGDYYYGEVDNGSTISYNPKKKQGQITTTHPYDEAEYHWARSTDGRNWQIVFSRHQVETFVGDAKQVVAELRKLDDKVEVKPIRAIY